MRPDDVRPQTPHPKSRGAPVTADDRVSSRPLLDRAVKVMLVDRTTVMREGLRALIDQQPDLEVVAEASTLATAGSAAAIPDVIVTDIDLPDARRGEVIPGLRNWFARSSILVLTLVGQPVKVQSVLDAGADGYLLKTAEATDLFTGIRALASGNTYLQPSLGVELARWHRPRDTTLGLSPKEERVLRLVALGYTNTEMARACGVGLRTIEAHRGRIHHKLGRRTRAELVRYAWEEGLVEVDPQ